MTDADVELFAQSLTGMIVAYGQQLDEARLFAYWEALQDIPIETVREAIAEGIRHCEFIPTIAVLRGLADRLTARHTESSHLLNERRLLAGETPDISRADADRSYACRMCFDTGFVRHVCSPDQPLDDRCGNPLCKGSEYRAHTYLTPCLCRPTNPVFQRTIMKKFKHEV